MIFLLQTVKFFPNIFFRFFERVVENFRIRIFVFSEIDGDIFWDLTSEDLKEIGVQKNIHRKTIIRKIAKAKREYELLQKRKAKQEHKSGKNKIFTKQKLSLMVFFCSFILARSSY